MKALVKTKLGADCMRYMDVAEPVPADDEIKVKIYACGICGTDIHLMHDTYPSNPPIITGHEFSGIVSEVGKNVSDFQPGDKIVTLTAIETCETCEWCRQGLRMLCPERKSVGSGINGGFAEYVTIPARHAFHLPAGVSMKTAALCEPLACVVRSVCERTTVHAGDYVLVSGAGVMGQLTAQVAHANGGIVIMTGLEADTERLAVAKELGGVYETVKVDQDGALEKILDLTNGLGPHVAYECAGVSSSVDFCLHALRKTGTYAQVSIPGKPVPVDMDLALYKEIILTNSYASERTSWLTALSLLEHHLINIDPLVSKVLPLERWEEGFQLAIEKKCFKVLLMPDFEGFDL